MPRVVQAPVAVPQSGKVTLALHQALSDEDDVNAQLKGKNFQPYHSKSVPRSQNLEATASDRTKSAEATTMMLRNIPNKYTQSTLLQEINEHGFEGTYDFFYLPMDVHNRSNVGYAFINFELPRVADRFQHTFSNHRFERFHSRKIGIVCRAHVQGLDQNLKHFENRAVLQARNDQYRPIVMKGQRRLDLEAAIMGATAKEGQGPIQAVHELPNVSKSSPDHGAFNCNIAPRDLAPPPGLTQVRDWPESRTGDIIDKDVVQLLSLRSLLVGHLSQGVPDTQAYLPAAGRKKGSPLHTELGVPSAKDCPAYVNVSGRMEFGGSSEGHDSCYDEWNANTPRTNALILGQNLNLMFSNDMWRSA
mmetsp:Transcript_33269/g.72611  ORF Transcript_33269/g.72611 Transcript_33269/m.72611 type:complete len:361 (+) Transcript_33269:58-1140(+)